MKAKPSPFALHIISRRLSLNLFTINHGTRNKNYYNILHADTPNDNGWEKINKINLKHGRNQRTAKNTLQFFHDCRSKRIIDRCLIEYNGTNLPAEKQKKMTDYDPSILSCKLQYLDIFEIFNHNLKPMKLLFG